MVADNGNTVNSTSNYNITQFENQSGNLGINYNWLSTNIGADTWNTSDDIWSVINNETFLLLSDERYILANGSRQLTANWSFGNYDINAYTKRNSY